MRVGRPSLASTWERAPIISGEAAKVSHEKATTRAIRRRLRRSGQPTRNLASPKQRLFESLKDCSIQPRYRYQLAALLALLGSWPNTRLLGFLLLATRRFLASRDGQQKPRVPTAPCTPAPVRRRSSPRVEFVRQHACAAPRRPPNRVHVLRYWLICEERDSQDRPESAGVVETDRREPHLRPSRADGTCRGTG